MSTLKEEEERDKAHNEWFAFQEHPDAVFDLKHPIDILRCHSFFCRLRDHVTSNAYAAFCKLTTDDIVASLQKLNRPWRAVPLTAAGGSRAGDDTQGGSSRGSHHSDSGRGGASGPSGGSRSRDYPLRSRGRGGQDGRDEGGGGSTEQPPLKKRKYDGDKTPLEEERHDDRNVFADGKDLEWQRQKQVWKADREKSLSECGRSPSLTKRRVHLLPDISTEVCAS